MVQFNFTFQPGMSLQQMIGFEIAGRVWGAYLTDNVTVNLHVGTTDKLPAGVLAGALPGFKTGQRYSQVEDLLENDATSKDDRAAAKASVRAGSNFSGAFNRYEWLLGGTLQTIEVSGGLLDSTISLPRANAKALEASLDTIPGNLDGYIVLNSEVKSSAGVAVPWNYNYTSGTVPSDTVDFLSTAIHEIGHVLGFVSSVDRPWKVSPTSYDLTAFRLSLAERLNSATLFDTFRTTATTSLLGLLQSSTVNLSVGGERYFSIDGKGKSSALGYFATGKDTALGGNGFQASHWRGDGSNSGIMNATLGRGQRAQFSTLDLRAFDVIGWDLSSSGINTILNWTNLQTQAKAALAARIGQSVSWLDANPDVAAALLNQDRLADVNTMIGASPTIYEGKRTSRSGDWQELFSLLEEQGLFDTVEELIAPPRSTHKNDVVAGSTEDDHLTGLRGNDRLIGFAGDDRLHGNLGRDLLQGGRGDDQLSGGNGRDWLRGGQGNDTLMGGAGRDVFGLELDAGIDVVVDFAIGEDKLKLLDGLQFSHLSLIQQSDHTLIQAEGHTLMQLSNVSAALITSAVVV